MEWNIKTICYIMSSFIIVFVLIIGINGQINDTLGNFSYISPENNSLSDTNETIINTNFKNESFENNSDLEIPKQFTDPAAQAFPIPTMPPKLPKYVPKQEFKHFEFCNCDLRVGACDVNCCCDDECTSEDRKVFTGCNSQHSIVEDDRYCFKTDILFLNNAIYKMNHTKSGLFCIQYDNNKATHFYKNVKPVTENAEFETLITKYDKSTGRNENVPSRNGMKIGDPIFTVGANGTPTKLRFPFAMMSSGCNYLQPMKYLVNEDSICYYNHKDNDPFMSKILEPDLYFPNIHILKDNNMINKSFDSTGSDALIPVSTLCIKQNNEVSNCSDINTQIMKVETVQYNFVHEGIKGISEVNLSLYLFNPTSDVMHMKTKITYVWKSDSMIKPFPRSGNPGYIFGKPVLAGYFGLAVENNNDTVVVDDNPMQWFTIMNNYECVEHNKTSNRIPVDFGENVKVGCTLELTYRDFLSKNCFTLDRLKWILVGKALPEYIAMFGNADPNKIEDWIPLIRGFVPSIKDEECVLYNLKIEFAYAYVGALSNPQAKIVGAMYKFQEKKIKFECMGICAPGETNLFEISTLVKFIDVTKSSTPGYSSPPVFKARLPKNFFYPILSGGMALNNFQPCFPIFFLFIILNYII